MPRRLARWADANAAALLGTGGLVGMAAGLFCSPWPWLAGVVVGGILFGGASWAHITGRIGGPDAR